ncbi:MAG: hypothetical protein ACI9S8_000468 [Chlamydiales bacterium]|jgi:hypothetical protein
MISIQEELRAIGYLALIEMFPIESMPHYRSSYVAKRGQRRTNKENAHEVHVYTKGYSLKDENDPMQHLMSSYEIERELPDKKRVARFVELLKEAENLKSLNKEKLIQLQNVTVDPRFADSDYRITQKVAKPLFTETPLNMVFFGATDDYEGPSNNFDLSEIELTLQSLQNPTKATHL